MKISLEVLTSVSIKRKKPWPKLAWIGQENEKLLLLDKTRGSILSLSTGKTKKNIGKLNSLLKTIITTCVTSDVSPRDFPCRLGCSDIEAVTITVGVYLIGVLTSGNLFVWQKDNDTLWMIEGLQNLASKPIGGMCQKLVVYSSQNVDVILAVTKLKHVFVWERHSDSIMDPKNNHLDGAWSAIVVGSGIPLPIPDAKDAVVQATVINDRVLGKTGLCSFVFNNGNCVCVSTVHLRWHGAHLDDITKCNFQVHWHSVQYSFKDLGPRCQPVSSVRAYVPRYARESLLLAVAINQKNSFNSRLVFVAPLNRAILAVDMQGCGARSQLSANKRCYQIADLVWTTDDALLAGITHHGCFFLVSRLGDLLSISTHGCQMDLRFNNFLNLLPLIKIRATNKGRINDANSDSQSTTSTVSATNIMKQHYTVTVHPSLPVLLCSDGYLVTCLLLPVGMEKSIGVMESLVIDANKTAAALQRHLEIFTSPIPLPWLSSKTSTIATQTPKAKLQVRRQKEPSAENIGQQIRRQWEEATNATNLESPTVSDLETTSSCSSTNIIDVWSNMQFRSSGKIDFGEAMDVFKIDTSSSQELMQQTIQEQDIAMWRSVVAHLVSAWGFVVSNPTIWDDKWQVMTSHTVKSFVQLCQLFSSQRLDHSAEIAKSSATSAQPTHPPIDIPTTLLLKCLDLLQFNLFNQNLIPAAIALIDGIIKVLLHWCSTRPIKIRGSLLLEVVRVLTKAEAKIMSVYQWEVIPFGGIWQSSSTWHPHTYWPSVSLCKFNGPLYKPDCQGLDSSYYQGQSKRFTKMWKRMYKAATYHWLQVQKQDLFNTEYKSSDKLLILLQERLQRLNVPLYQRRGRVKEGTILCLRGCYDEALGLWIKEQKSLLQGLGSSPHAMKRLCQCLHSILYTFLQNCEFSMSLRFVNMLMTANLKERDEKEATLYIVKQHSAIKRTILTMARFLARYFTCNKLFIYPPYQPKCLPSLLDEEDNDKGCMILSRETVKAVVVGEGLSSTWTPEAALSLLLLGGSFAEAVWFLLALGDWKMAFLLAVAFDEIGRNISSNRRIIRAIELPLKLQPIEILSAKLKKLLGLTKEPSDTASEFLIADGLYSEASKRFSKHATKDDSYFIMNRMLMLRDHLTAGILSGLEIMPVLIRDGINQLESLIKDLPFSVPCNFYLPAPPFYCLQDDGEPICTASHREVLARTSISALIQLVLDVYKSSHTLLPVAFNYAKHLSDRQEVGNLVAAEKCINILDPFNQYQEKSIHIPFSSDGKIPSSFVTLLDHFHYLCTIVWLLHCRDEMEIASRKLWKKLETALPFCTKATQGKLALAGLHWAKRLSPFVSLMDWDWDFNQTVLTLVLESSSTTEVCEAFAACIPDLGVLPPQMEPRLHLLMKHWKTVSVKTGNTDGKSNMDMMKNCQIMWLSDYHSMMCKKYQSYSSGLQRQFLGLHATAEDFLNSCSLETDAEFLDFITLFFDVIIHKNAEEYMLAPEIPLLLVCKQQQLQKELLLMSHDVVATMQKKKLVSFSINPTNVVTLPAEKDSLRSTPVFIGKKHCQDKRKRFGLFQTNSSYDLRKNSTKSPVITKAVTSVPEYLLASSNGNTLHHAKRKILSSSKPVRQTQSMPSLEQSSRHASLKPKQFNIVRKGNNTTLTAGFLMDACSSHTADCCSVLFNLESCVDGTLDVANDSYKTTHLILWLYRWANKAHLQFGENMCDALNLSKPQIRVQVPVDSILAAMTLQKKKFTKHKVGKLTDDSKVSKKNVSEETEYLCSNARQPSKDYDLKPTLIKATDDRNENSRVLENDTKMVHRYVNRNQTNPDKSRSVDELNSPIHFKAPSLPKTRKFQNVKLKTKSDMHHFQLSNEVKKSVKKIHNERLGVSTSSMSPESQVLVKKDGVTNSDIVPTSEHLQSNCCRTLPKIKGKLMTVPLVGQVELRNTVNFTQDDEIMLVPPLPHYAEVEPNIDLLNSRSSPSITQTTSRVELVNSHTENLQLDFEGNEDNTLDDVTSPESMQMFPSLDHRQKSTAKAKKCNVHNAKNGNQQNNFGIPLLTVDSRFLNSVLKDKMGQARKKSYLFHARIKENTTTAIPHFLRLKAEKDSDDSFTNELCGNPAPTSNSGHHNDRLHNEENRSDNIKDSESASARLRGGGSRHIQPFPLFTFPPLPLTSQPTPIQPPNIVQVQPAGPHRGYPFLHLPQKYKVNDPTIQRNEQCHVCNKDSSCEENVYVQGRLRKYWQDVQQASFCPATISEPFSPMHPPPRPLITVPSTPPCYQLQNSPCIPTCGRKPQNSFAHNHLLPYSVVPLPLPHEFKATCLAELTSEKNEVSRHQPLSHSETSLNTACANATLQTVYSNKLVPLSMVPSLTNKLSHRHHGIAAAPSVSEPDMAAVPSACDPDVAVAAGPYFGNSVTSSSLCTQMPVATMSQHPIDIPYTILQKGPCQSDDKQSVKSHGEVHSMQSHSEAHSVQSHHLHASQPKNCLLELGENCSTFSSYKQAAANVSELSDKPKPTTSQPQLVSITKFECSQDLVGNEPNQTDTFLAKNKYKPSFQVAALQQPLTHALPEYGQTATRKSHIQIPMSSNIADCISQPSPNLLTISNGLMASCESNFSKQAVLSNPTNNILDIPSNSTLFGAQHAAEQRRDVQNTLLLLDSSLTQNISPLPAHRVEYAEAQFQVVHELEKAKRFLSDLHARKDAASKEVQTEGNFAVVRLARCLEELDKTVQEKCFEYCSEGSESKNNCQIVLQDCRTISKSQKKSPTWLSNKSIRRHEKTEICRPVYSHQHRTNLLCEETPVVDLKSLKEVPMYVRRDISLLSCRTSDLMLYGRIAPGAKHFKHIFPQTTNIASSLQTCEPFSLPKIPQRISHLNDNMHDSQQPDNTFNSQHNMPTPFIPVISRVTSVFDHHKTQGAPGNSPLPLANVQQQLPEACNDVHHSPRCAKMSSAYSLHNCSNKEMTPLEHSSNIPAMIHGVGITLEKSMHAHCHQQEANKRGYTAPNNTDTANIKQNEKLFVPDKDSYTCKISQAEGLPIINDSTCELYGRRLRNVKHTAQYDSVVQETSHKCALFPLNYKSEGEQNDKEQEDFHTNATESLSSHLCIPTSDAISVGTNYLPGFTGAWNSSVTSCPPNHSALTSIKHTLSTEFKSLDDKQYKTDSSCPSSLLWPPNHVPLHNLEQALSFCDGTENRTSVVAQDIQSFTTVQQQYSNTPADTVQCMSQNCTDQLYQGLMPQLYQGSNQCSRATSSFETGNDPNRQTSGQDTEVKSKTASAQQDENTPSKAALETNWDDVDNSDRLTSKSKLMLTDGDPDLSIPQEEHFYQNTSSLLQNVEMASPYLRETSGNSSDPPTDEIPRRVAMGTVHRRLQSINEHIKVIEKISYELETDFQDSKELLRRLEKNTTSDPLPSAYSTAIVHNSGAMPFRRYQLPTDRYKLRSNNKHSRFEESTRYKSDIKRQRSRSLSPPSASSKSKSISGGKDHPISSIASGGKEISAHRLVRFGSFQQLLFDNRTDFQDASSVSSTVCHNDRAFARQAQKDVHFKIRMQDACQLMDEIIAAEPVGPVSSIYSSTPSPSLTKCERRHRGTSDVHNYLPSPRKQTNSERILSHIGTDSGETTGRISGESKRIQKLLRDNDVADLGLPQPNRRYHFDPEVVDLYEESIGKVSAFHASSNREVQERTFKSSKVENQDLFRSKKVKSHSRGLGLTCQIPTVTESTRFGATYSLGQPISLASPIAEVSEETDPTSKRWKKNFYRQSRRPIVKNKVMKSKVPKRRLAVRMTKAALLRKKLSQVKVAQGNISNQRQTNFLTSNSSGAAGRLQLNSTRQLKVMPSNLAQKINSPVLEYEEHSLPDSWEVPEDIQRILYGSQDNSLDANQSTDEFDEV